MGPLHGIPLLLKDNIETLDPLPTTAGSLALMTARHSADAPVAARLRAAGAIVLGKANLSEWANFRSSRSVSGWSGVGGQACCPYDPIRNPSGSSAGSAAGTSANLCAAAIGSETDGSIFNNEHASAEMPFFGQELFVQSQACGPLTATAYVEALHRILDVSDTHGLAAMFDKYRVDALVAPGNGPAELIDHVWGDRAENSGGWPPMCSAAAVAGYPSLTVPAGFGRAFERERGARQPPKLAET